MLERIKTIYQTCDSDDPVVPPTMLFNEGWLLRLILDWFSNNRIQGHQLDFDSNFRWYSEALLRSPFLPRHRGDPLSESWTHADAVVGNFAITDKFNSELQLTSSIRHLVVLEAKIYSKLSQGVTNASYYDQAARYVACIAELLHVADFKPASVDKLAFHVLAPKSQIDSNVFANELSRESIYKKVERRTGEYGNDKKSWFDNWFIPTLDKIKLSPISWEEIIASIDGVDHIFGTGIGDFYNKCLKYNEHVKTSRFF